MRGEKATKPCDMCGQPSTKLVSQAKGKGWYCSTSCSARSQWKQGNHPLAVTDNPQRGERATRACANCGAPVTRYLSQRLVAQFWTCSKRCLGIARNKRLVAEGRLYRPTKPRRGETVPCERCGAPVYRNKSQAAKGEGRYCSRECHNSAQVLPAIVKSCSACGIELRLKPSQAHRQYCTRVCMGRGMTARPLDRMHNGRPARLDADGYVSVWEPTHPNKSYKGWQFEHRLVAEEALGRHLVPGEEVDHINRNKQDNRPENLQVLSAEDHLAKTVQDVRQDRIDLAEYRRRGPL